LIKSKLPVVQKMALALVRGPAMKLLEPVLAMRDLKATLVKVKARICPSFNPDLLSKIDHFSYLSFQNIFRLLGS
jgi:hypothetical protein